MVDRTCAAIHEHDQAVVRLLTSELVSNAVVHGGAPIVMVIEREDASVLVEVHDEGVGMPSLVEAVDESFDGDPLLATGLRMVAAMATSWGVVERGFGQPGKQVWFRLDESEPVLRVVR